MLRIGAVKTAKILLNRSKDKLDNFKGLDEHVTDAASISRCLNKIKEMECAENEDKHCKC